MYVSVIFAKAKEFGANQIGTDIGMLGVYSLVLLVYYFVVFKLNGSALEESLPQQLGFLTR